MSKTPRFSHSILATSLLLLMGLLLLLSESIFSAYPFAEWLIAFSEAAVVGALADWFAVTALFRHPLGIPIPHTAIVPKSKERLADSLGVFVQENFLNEEVITGWLREHPPSFEITHYLSVPENRAAVITRFSHLAQDLLSSLDDEATRQALTKIVTELGVKEINLAPLLGKILNILLKADKDDAILHELLRHSEALLGGHEEVLRRAIGAELPWYLPRFVQNRLYRSVISASHRFFREVNSSPLHPAKLQIKEYLYTFADKLVHDSELASHLQGISRALLTSPEIQQFVEELWRYISTALSSNRGDARHPVEGILELFFTSVVETLLKDPVLGKRVDHLIEKLSRRVASDYSSEIIKLISETMRKWDSKTLVTKIEENVGRDLQFIRINGTVVGGLVGLILHVIRTSF